MYANRESCAERKTMNSILVVQSEGDKEEGILVARVLVLCRYFVKGDTQSANLASAQYMKCVPPSDVVDEALGCVRLR